MANAYVGFGNRAKATLQSLPIPGREAEMTPNNAGGVGFILDDWKRLERFLILGSDGGSYYVNQKDLTAQNADVVIRCIKTDGVRVACMAEDINVNNRAPKTDPQLFALALCMKYGDALTKKTVEDALLQVLRTGTHFLHFVAMLDSLGGWNRSKRRVAANWFENQSADNLAFQVVKYQNRDGWRMRDALRVAHPKATTPVHGMVYDWLCGRKEGDRQVLPRVLAFHDLVHVDASYKPILMDAVSSGLPREALPTEALNDPDVWRAMLPTMPLHALLRNLGNLSANGVLQIGKFEVDLVAAKLTDKAALKKARVHPFAILLATLVYKTGRGVKSNKTWIPVPAILSALEDAYDLAFDNVVPTGKRILIGIDVSGSMGAPCIGTPIPASTAAAAVAVTLARMEPNAVVVQFDTAVQCIVPVTKRTGIAGLESRAGGGTSLSAPITWAMGKQGQWNSGPEAAKTPFDAFVILTDNETWAGSAHPSQALEDYRRKVMGYAKLVCCSFAANHANIVDPKDPLSFGCAGLDAHIPSLVADFIR